MKIFVLAVPLLAMLAGAIWFAAHSFVVEGPDMPAGLYIAMILGIVFSILVGSGLMMLVFYSSRYGYDEPNREEPPKE